MPDNDVYDLWYGQKSGPETFYLLGLSGGSQVDALQIPKAVQTIGNGPAVNISGLH